MFFCFLWPPEGLCGSLFAVFLAPFLKYGILNYIAHGSIIRVFAAAHHPIIQVFTAQVSYQGVSVSDGKKSGWLQPLFAPGWYLFVFVVTSVPYCTRPEFSTAAVG